MGSFECWLTNIGIYRSNNKCIICSKHKQKMLTDFRMILLRVIFNILSYCNL